MKNDIELIKQVNQIYDWLDTQIKNNRRVKDSCRACGKCCSFKEFGHRLFITTPELYLHNFTIKESKLMTTDICPYNKDGKCLIYKHRFAGCRIFFCKADKTFQSILTETAIKKLKEICLHFKIPYHYMDLKTALNQPLLNIYPSDDTPLPPEHEGRYT